MPELARFGSDEEGSNIPVSPNTPMDPEKNSKKTVKIWLPETTEGRGEYIGEIAIENGEFVAMGETDEDTEWLNQKLQNIWIPQSGIPLFKKQGAEFIEDSEGRFVADGYRNHGNCSADDLLEAIYDYTRAMGTFKTSFEDRV